MRKVKSILLLLIILPSLLFFTACGEDNNGDNSNNGGTNTKYNINFIVDEVVYSTIESSGNEYIKFPENPTKQGYDFKGWYFDKDVWQNELKTSTYLNQTITKNINVYAYFTECEIIYYTITFKVENEIYNIKQVQSGNKLEKPSIDPTKANYEFIGWYNGEIEWNFNENLVSKDITLFAKFKQNIYNVSFVTSYDIVTCEYSIETEYSTQESTNLTAKIKEIFEIDGYENMKVDIFNNSKIRVEASYISDSKAFSSVYSDFSIISYSKFFISDNNYINENSTVVDGSKHIKEIKIFTNNNINYISIIFNNEGQNLYKELCKKSTTLYIHIGTYCQSITVENVIDYTSFTLSDSNFENLIKLKKRILIGCIDTKIYPDINSINILTVDKNIIDTKSVTSGEKIQQPTTPYISGFVFDGWYNGETLWNFETDVVKDNLILTAKFVEIQTVTFMVDGFIYHQYEQVENKNIVEKPINPKLFNYLFKGWYNGETLWNFETDIVKDNLILTAKFDYGYTCIGTTVTGLTDYGKDLSDIYIDEKITEISSYAFQDSVKLKTIIIPSNLTIIGKSAFYGCNGLTSVYYEGTLDQWCNIEFIDYDSNPMYYAKHFYIKDGNNEYNELTEIEIPETITKLKANVFSGFDNITKIIIPNKLTTIDSHVFYDCINLIDIYYLGTIEQWCSILFSSSISNPMYYAKHFYIKDGNNEYNELTEIEIPETITIIKTYTFIGFNNIIKVTLPRSVTNIDYSAFNACYRLVEVKNLSNLNIVAGSSSNGYVGYYAKRVYTEGESGISIDKDGFVTYNDGTDIYLVAYQGQETNIIIPNYITKINDFAFYNCSSLESIEVSNSIKSIGIGAFTMCSNLIYKTYNNAKYLGNSDNPYLVLVELINSNIESCIIHSNTKFIYSSAFYGCSSLTNIVIPSNIKNIGSYAFAFCSNLTSVVIPSSITSIGSYAFYECYRLVEVKNLSNLNIVAGSSSNGYIGYYAKRVYTEGESYISKDSNGFVTYNDGTDIYLVAYQGQETNITISSNVTKINNYAFYNCNNLTSITFEENSKLTNINKYAFYYCSSLISIVIPESVTSIGEDAFSYCRRLVEVKNLSNLNIVAGSSNYGYVSCYALRVYYKGESYLNTDANGFVTYNNGTDVYLVSYQGTETDITIPSSVTKINQYAFEDCSSLTSVTFKNTSGWNVSQYNNMSSSISLSSSNLSNPSTAAKYLTSIYDNYYWKRD